MLLYFSDFLPEVFIWKGMLRASLCVLRPVDVLHNTSCGFPVAHSTQRRGCGSCFTGRLSIVLSRRSEKHDKSVAAGRVTY